MTLSFLKLDNHIFKDLNDLLDNYDKINSDYVVLIYKDFGLTEDFITHLDTIKNLKENIILSSENIYKNEKLRSAERIVDYNNYQNSEMLLDKLIYCFKVNKIELKELLEDKSIKTFFDLTKKINFSKICLDNCITRIQFINNMIDVNEKLFFNNFRNKKNIENISNLKGAYFNFIKNNKYNKTYHKQIVKIYNEVNRFTLSYIIIIADEQEKLNKLIDCLSDSELNNKYNELIIFSEFKNNNSDLKFEKISYYSNFETEYYKLIKNTENNYDVYFFDSIDKIKNLNDNKKTQIYYNNEKNNFDLLKMNSLLLKFINLELEGNNKYDNYLEKFGDFIINYFKYELFIVNEKINCNYSPNEIKFIPDITLIDILYDNKLYDESCYLINFIIKNKLSFNFTFIYKTLVLVDKVNYVIGKNEIKSLLNLLDLKEFDELFNLCIVLFHNNCQDLALKSFNKFISENNIEEENIFKFILLGNLFKIFNKEIDLSQDKDVINHLVNHYVFIIENFDNIKNLDNTVNTENLLNQILVFLNNRTEVYQNENIKDKVENKITNLTLDFNKLDTYNEKHILEKFIKYPKIIINGCYMLSDIMMSEKDILLKRNNLLLLTTIIVKNMDLLEDKFVSMIKKGDTIELDNLFRFAYHGIGNKILFENCIKITRKFLELKYRVDLNLLKKDLPKDESENLFYYEPKKTNPKKICFIADFLTRKHSVFKDRHQVILNLVKKGFEVYVATFTPFNFKWSQIFYGIKENIVLANMNSFNIVQKIRSYNFDKLVFCEIGMDNRVVKIAHFRMANKQYNTWGHSDTSGFEEIDYYVSSELYELPYEISKDQYSEKLILQKGMCTAYVNPTDCYELKTPRSYYGLSDYETVICCPQSLFKIHPIFDEYLFEILKRNRDVSIVFLDNHDKKFRMYERWNTILKDKPQYHNLLSRVKFLPGQDHQKFCNLMKVSDVMIDPFPFGGCNGSLESFSLGKPLVSQPSNRINGRFTYGFYKRMGFMDLVANDKEEYISLVTKLINDKQFYSKMVDKIKENKDKLFMDQETLDEWEELMAS